MGRLFRQFKNKGSGVINSRLENHIKSEYPRLPSSPPRFLRLPEVLGSTGVGKTLFYKMIKRGEFPPAIKLGAARVWPEEDVRTWQQKMKMQRMILEAI
jgi:prophage regulatory protein